MSSLQDNNLDVQSEVASVLSESWVDLEKSNGELNLQKNMQSFYNGEMERLLKEAQREGSTPSRSRGPSNPSSHLNSPPRTQSLASSQASPHVSGTNSPKGNKPITPLCDVLPELPGPEGDATWIWDWSSKPLLKAPEESQFQHPRPKGTPLSLRNTEAMKHDFFSWEFLQVFIPSIIVTNLVAFGIGVYVGKRLMREASKSS